MIAICLRLLEGEAGGRQGWRVLGRLRAAVLGQEGDVAAVQEPGRAARGQARIWGGVRPRCCV